MPVPPFHDDRVGSELDAFMAKVRQKKTWRAIWFWAPEPQAPAGLPLRLMARGFRHRFEPHWMWIGLGFQSLRHAQPRQYPIDVQALPRTPEQVQFAEAIGSSDVESLERDSLHVIPLVNEPRLCRRTPFQSAALFGQEKSAERS